MRSARLGRRDEGSEQARRARRREHRAGPGLRDAANALDLDVNHPFDGLVAARRSTGATAWSSSSSVPAANGSRTCTRRGSGTSAAATVESKIAAYLDSSVYNLSSIVVLARAKRKTMLLTGDARGDDVLAGLREAGLLRRSPLHVDVLKLPHHGSDRNVETDFFRKIVADHYVVSADGGRQPRDGDAADDLGVARRRRLRRAHDLQRGTTGSASG